MWRSTLAAERPIFPIGLPLLAWTCQASVVWRPFNSSQTRIHSPLAFVARLGLFWN